MTIRVLRVIEYEYVDENALTSDMPRWTTSIASHRGMTMRSSVVAITSSEGHLLTPETLQHGDTA